MDKQNPLHVERFAVLCYSSAPARRQETAIPKISTRLTYIVIATVALKPHVPALRQGPMPVCGCATPNSGGGRR